MWCLYAHACVPVKGRDGCRLSSLPTPSLSDLVFETGSLAAPEVTDMLISLHAQGMGYVSFPVLLCLAFYTSTGDLNSGPHACVATAVSAEPSPQPSTRTLKELF